MKICLTGSSGSLGKAIETRWAGRHSIVSWPDRTELPVKGDNAPRDIESLTALLHGVDAVVHTENFAIELPADSKEEALAFHRATTDSYHLCSAAVTAGVDRIIVIASLNVFSSIDPKYLVEETWRPRPEPDAPHILPFLASECVREFVRHGPINGCCLRFGRLGDHPENGTRVDSAIEAIDRALALDFDPSDYRWHVIHVANSPRFPDRNARRVLGMPPTTRPNA